MSAAAPRVALVVPIHNAAPFLQETLDSVLAQSYPNWEAVLVDDASSDGSDALAADYVRRHPDRFRLIRLEQNAGVVATRNRALEAAREADLIALLDHDDRLRERYLERMVEIYERERAAGRRMGIVGCDALLHEPGGRERVTWSEHCGWYDEVNLDTLLRQNTIFARALFSRAALSEVGGFSEECSGSDDWDLWLRIVEAGYEVAVTREPLAVYRLHTGAMSQDRLRMTESTLRLYRRALERDRLSPRQRRLVHRRMRHIRAERANARFRQARAGGRRLDALRCALLAIPPGLVATLQDPAVWRRKWHRRKRGLELAA